MLHSALSRDLRYSWRSIRTHPVFSFLVILILALGIGANTAVFSVVSAVLLQLPPYPAGERLTQIWETGSGQRLPVSRINFQHWRAENHSFEEMAGTATAVLTLTGRGEPALTHVGLVDAAFFRLTGWQPLAGQLPAPLDDRPGAPLKAVVTYEFWKTRLHAATDAMGSSLVLDRKPYVLIGILPPGLRYFSNSIDVYLAGGPFEGNPVSRSEHGTTVLLGRLRPGVSLAAGKADLDAIMGRLAIADPGSESDHRAALEWLADYGSGDVRQTLLLLMASTGFVLLIAIANAAGLMLVRSSEREREMAIRSALGGGRGSLFQQLLMENLLLAALGGCLGAIFAGAGIRILKSIGPQEIPRLSEASLNFRVLLFAGSVAVLTGILTSLAPAARNRRTAITSALRDGEHSAAARRGRSLHEGLVICQLAFTLVLSFASTLLIHSLVLARNSDPGFRSAGVLALETQLPAAVSKDDAAVNRFYRQLIGTLQREPGVLAVGAVNCPPSTGGCARGWYSIPGMPTPRKEDVPLTLLTKADPRYFRTLEIPLLAGRAFDEADREGTPEVAIVNEKIARYWWPDEPQRAVGHSIKFGGPYMAGPTLQIIGVAGSVHQAALDEPAFAEVYVPFAQNPSSSMVLMIRTAGDPQALAPAVRRDLAAADRDLPIQSLRPFTQWMQSTLERRRFRTWLFGLFALLGWVLAAAGVYGMLNYWVAVRRREIAIRYALGAHGVSILRWIGLHAARLVLPGIAFGVAGCWGASRWLQSLTFRISAWNPFALTEAAAAVIALALLASCIPLWRGVQVNAAQSLRDS